MKFKKVKKYKEGKFKRTVGIPRELFNLLVEVLEESFKIKHSKGGRIPELVVEDMLLLTLSYYRDYTTFFKLGMYYDLDESNVYRTIKWVEGIIKSFVTEMFSIDKIDLTKELIVDVMECNIQRPSSNDMQKEYYSGKKKKHTIKIQLIIEAVSKKIVFVAFDKGSVHDFNLFKNSTQELDVLAKFLADSGYQGIDKIFKNSMTPKKKSKLNPLSSEDKELNKLISSIRISIEHTNCQLKIFRILSERYRNRRDTFDSRALFICSLYNFSL